MTDVLYLSFNTGIRTDTMTMATTSAIGRYIQFDVM